MRFHFQLLFLKYLKMLPRHRALTQSTNNIYIYVYFHLHVVHSYNGLPSTRHPQQSPILSAAFISAELPPENLHKNVMIYNIENDSRHFCRLPHTVFGSFGMVRPGSPTKLGHVQHEQMRKPVFFSFFYFFYIFNKNLHNGAPFLELSQFVKQQLANE